MSFRKIALTYLLIGTSTVRPAQGWSTPNRPHARLSVPPKPSHQTAMATPSATMADNAVDSVGVSRKAFLVGAAAFAAAAPFVDVAEASEDAASRDTQMITSDQNTASQNGDSSTSYDIPLPAAVGVGMVTGSVLTRSDAERVAPTSLADRPPYKPGAKPTLPSSTFGKNVRVYDPSVLKSSYSLMISTVTPRPIALVSSRHGTTGVDNVSPFSYFGALAHDPPMIAIGFCRNGGAKKDSLQNIESNNGQFCVNIISEWYLDAANHSCGNFASSVDEFDVSGMTKINDCEVVNAPRVKEAAVSYECELQHIHALTNDATGKATTEIVLAKVVRVHVDSTVLMANSDVERPAVDTMQLKPVGRLGGNIYSMIGETVDIPRPKVS